MRFEAKSAAATVASILAICGCTRSAQDYLYLGAVTPSQIVDGDPRWIGNELVLMGDLEISGNFVWIVDQATGDKMAVDQVPGPILECLQSFEFTYVGLGATYDVGGVVFNGNAWRYGERLPQGICGTP